MCSVTINAVATDLDAAQRHTADFIYRIVVGLGGSVWQAAAAIACAGQESSLTNLPAGDKDSLGLFQQRPSQGWGTVTQIADPTYAVVAFCHGTANTSAGLFDLPSGLTMAQAIQAVQQSANGALYAQWTDAAIAIALEDSVPANPPVPVDWFPAFSQGNAGRPEGLDFIVIHSVEGPLETGLAVSLADFYFGTSASHETSAHVIVGPDAIVEMVKPGNRAWHCGNGNMRGYGIEQTGYARFSRDEWLTGLGVTQMQNVAWWAAGICRAYGIPARWLTDAQLATQGEKGFCTHSDVTRVLGGTTHTDPGPNYPRDLLITAVAAQLAGTPAPEDSDMTPAESATLAKLERQMSLLMQAMAVDQNKVSAADAHIAVSPYSIANKLDAVKRQLDAILRAISLDAAGKTLPVYPYTLFNLLNQTHALVAALTPPDETPPPPTVTVK